MEKKKLKILLLSGVNMYENSGILAFDIFKSLKIAEHDVVCITRDFDSRFEQEIVSINGRFKSFASHIIFRIEKKIKSFRSYDESYYLHSLNDRRNRIGASRLLKHISTPIDLILYVFPHRFMDSKDLYDLNTKTGAPVFVFPVDMAQFTGGCHYANNCIRYKDNCGNCPGLYSKNEFDQSHKNLLYKYSYIQKMDIAVLANSWLNTRAKQSLLYFNKPIYNLDIVVDESVYCRADKPKAKQQFSIPTDKFVIFFGAATLEQKRKGLRYLIDALALLYSELSCKDRDRIIVVIAGNITKNVVDLLDFETRLLGHLSHEILPKSFQMADVFVSPSIQDAGPMMVVQSMMCGTPVVAFDTGNAEEFVINDMTGIKVDLYDTVGLKEGIKRVFQKTDNEREQMNLNCRSLAVQRSSYSCFTDKLIAIYNDYVDSK